MTNAAQAHRDRGFLLFDSDLIAPGHYVCETCELIVHDDAKNDHDLFNPTHKKYAVLTNRARSGWVPCVGHMAAAAARRGHPSEYEGARSGLLAIEFVRVDGIEDLLSSMPARSTTARVAAQIVRVVATVRDGRIGWRRAIRKLRDVGQVFFRDMPDWLMY